MCVFGKGWSGGGGIGHVLWVPSDVHGLLLHPAGGALLGHQSRRCGSRWKFAYAWDGPHLSQHTNGLRGETMSPDTVETSANRVRVSFLPEYLSRLLMTRYGRLRYLFLQLTHSIPFSFSYATTEIIRVCVYVG